MISRENRGSGNMGELFFNEMSLGGYLVGIEELFFAFLSLGFSGSLYAERNNYLLFAGISGFFLLNFSKSVAWELLFWF